MASLPDISDYTDSVQNAESQMLDPALKNAKPRMKSGKPEMMSGGVAVVYPFQVGGDIYAVKCWLRDIGDLRDHYRSIEQFLNSAKSPYFVSFAYVENGIIAKDKAQPFLRMKWVGGKSLLEFVNANVTNRSVILMLAERYLNMCKHQHKLGVAHGDQQGSNIKVEGSGAAIEIKLIDYDTLIIPSFVGKKADTLALPSYQHANRCASLKYTGKEDYFSELVIYISLLAVAEKPGLWNDYPKGGPGLRDEDRHDKDMLFVKEDFSAACPTSIFTELDTLSPLVRALTHLLWNYTRKSKIEDLLPLEKALELAEHHIKSDMHLCEVSSFSSLLNTLNNEKNSWFDDSAFPSRKETPAVPKIASKPTRTTSFDELLKEGNKTAYQVNIKPPPALKPLTIPSKSSSATQAFPWRAIIIAVIGIYFVFYLIVDKNQRVENSNSNIPPITASGSSIPDSTNRRNLQLGLGQSILELERELDSLEIEIQSKTIRVREELARLQRRYLEIKDLESASTERDQYTFDSQKAKQDDEALLTLINMYNEKVRELTEIKSRNPQVPR